MTVANDLVIAQGGEAIESSIMIVSVEYEWLTVVTAERTSQWRLYTEWADREAVGT